MTTLRPHVFWLSNDRLYNSTFFKKNIFFLLIFDWFVNNFNTLMAYFSGFTGKITELKSVKQLLGQYNFSVFDWFHGF